MKDMSLYDMMSIVDNVAEKVCFIDDELKFHYRPELKNFYLNLYYAAYFDEKPDFETEDDIDTEKAFIEMISPEWNERLMKNIPDVIRIYIEDAVDKKIQYLIDEHRNIDSTSLSDMAIARILNLISDKVESNGDLLNEVGTENIKNFITNFANTKNAMSATKVVKAMKTNKVI